MFYVGLDESGHGSIAGPMTVGVVKVSDTFDHQILWNMGVRDSKLTTDILRKGLVEELKQVVSVYSIVIPVTDINQYKHSHAFDNHVKAFVESQGEASLEMYIDGLRTIDSLTCKATYIVNGDQSNALIAAASIIGKYAHDLAIEQLDTKYPDWDFKSHRGYPIPDHVAKIVTSKPIAGVHKLNPTYTAINNYCKKNGLKIPKWASSKERLKRILCN